VTSTALLAGYAGLRPSVWAEERLADTPEEETLTTNIEEPSAETAKVEETVEVDSKESAAVETITEATRAESAEASNEPEAPSIAEEATNIVESLEAAETEATKTTVTTAEEASTELKAASTELTETEETEETPAEQCLSEPATTETAVEKEELTQVATTEEATQGGSDIESPATTEPVVSEVATDEETSQPDAEEPTEEPATEEATENKEDVTEATSTEGKSAEAADPLEELVAPCEETDRKEEMSDSPNSNEICPEPGPGLTELCAEMKDAVNAALAEFDALSAEVIDHINLMQKVMQLNLTVKDEDAWNEMFLVAQSKSDKAKSVEVKEGEALLAITKVLDNIYAWRKSDETSDNTELDLAAESANAMIYQMDQAKAKVAAVETEALAMEKFRDLVEAGKEEFHKEMASIMPDVELGEKSGALSEYELNMFITHAYKKVLFLQQEVARQQTMEQAKLSKALEMQRKEAEAIAKKYTDEELEKQAKEMKEDHEKRVSKIRKDAEEQLTSHLKRQAAAHTDHVNDMLSTQKEEMQRKHDHLIVEQAADMTRAHSDSLITLGGSLSGLTAALEERSASDSAALAAQSLWLACSNLKTALNTGNTEATTWEAKLRPLMEEVAQVKTAADPKDQFTGVILATMSPVALQRGVLTEDSLIEKFCKVENAAKRVAGIGEEGGSLLAFGLSYVQSILMLDLTHRAPAEALEQVDLSTISATDLISLARHNLDRGNLGQAVQLMSQLKGEPGRVATDWLAEARLTLETQQAVEAMLVYSQANSCMYLPGSRA
jgi:mitofilin